MSSTSNEVFRKLERRLPWTRIAKHLEGPTQDAGVAIEQLELGWEVGLAQDYAHIEYQSDETPDNKSLEELTEELRVVKMEVDVKKALTKSIYRLDTREVLGSAKGRYTLYQNHQLIGRLCVLAKQAGAVIICGGQLDGGRRVFAVMRMPKIFKVAGENFGQYFIACASHDGTSGVWFRALNTREACGNIISSAYSTGRWDFRFRHTKTIHDRVESAIEILAQLRERTMQWKKEMEALTKVSVTEEDCLDIILKVYLNSKEYKLTHINNPDRVKLHKLLSGSSRLTKIKEIHKLFNSDKYGQNTEAAFGTAYGVIMAITAYHTHFSYRDGKNHSAGEKHFKNYFDSSRVEQDTVAAYRYIVDKYSIKFPS